MENTDMQLRIGKHVCVAGALLALLVLPSTALAQTAASITGVVRDTSGAVLPGVTVEAASPALIEKVRSAVTDGQGRYSITDLQVGSVQETVTVTGATPIVDTQNTRTQQVLKTETLQALPGNQSLTTYAA